MKKIILLLLMLIIGLFLFAQTATMPEGDGTPANPYQISSLTNLYWLSINPAVWNSYFVQTADINAAETVDWNSGSGFIPIGNVTTPFTGSYNGQDFSIYGLVINRPLEDNTGLFGKTSKYPTSETGAKLKNIRLTSATVYGANNSGLLAGYCSTNSMIENCSTSGSVHSANQAGGLVGWLENQSQINTSFSTAEINGINNLGGFAGKISNSTILNSYSRGNVNRITGSTGNEIGGFAGYLDIGTIKYSYSTGSVTYIASTSPTNKGFLGLQNGTCVFTANYFDKTTSGQTANKQASVLAAIGKESGEMKYFKIFTTTGWGFLEHLNPNAVWNINSTKNDGYPYFKWQYPADGLPVYIGTMPNGQGTLENPYEIANLSHLIWIDEFSNRWDKHYIQTASIDAATTINWNDAGTSDELKEGWLPIGNSVVQFTGFYNGQGHIINNLYIYRPTTDNIGFFGYSNNAEISALGTINVNFTGASSVGGFVGYNYHTPLNECFSTGEIKGLFRIGGLIGWNYSLNANHQSTITNCYSKTNVSRITDTYEACGGLIGFNFNSSVSYSYSTGSIIYMNAPSPTNKGFIGNSSGTTIFTSNYFDKESSGQTAEVQAVASAAIGKTTLEMHNQNTFIGWNFPSIWLIQGNYFGGYPYFVWQAENDPTLPVTLSSFTASVTNSQLVNLQWITQSEHDLNGFYLYRSNTDLSSDAVRISNLITATNTSNEMIYQYSDNEIPANGTYYYWIVSSERNGHSEWHGYASVSVNSNPVPIIPVNSSLLNSYPNPFKPESQQAILSCEVKENEIAEIRIFNTKGQMIRSLGNIPTGNHQIIWDGKDKNGKRCPSGIYFYRFNSPSNQSIRKVMILK